MTALTDYTDLKDWFKTIGRMGVQLRTTFAEETALMKRVDQIERALTEYRENTTTNYNDHARKIAAGDGDIPDIIELANHAAIETTPQHYERVLEVFERTLEFAMTSAFRTFRRRGATILGTIRPEFDTLATRIVHAAAVIPQGVMNLDDAARLGHGVEYLQLERDIEQWDQIAALIRDWITARVLEKTHPDLTSKDFMLEDTEAYRTERANLARPVRAAQGIAAGLPNLRVPTEKPLAPILNDEDRWRGADANHADREAREALGLTK